MKRFLRKALIGLAWLVAVLVVLVALFYAEEDWRGARDWAACQKELAAKGESLDLRVLAPPGKPEDDLSKVPIFAELYEENEAYKKTKSSHINPRIEQVKVELNESYHSDVPKTANYLKGEPIDLTAWQKYYRSIPEVHLPKQVGTPAQDILQALKQFDPELNEVDAAVSNPNAYFPINYESHFECYVGAIVRMIPIARVIQLRGNAYLDNNESDLAEKDYLFSFRINRPLSKGCFVINSLVMIGVRIVDDSILWQGLRHHAWNDAQLHEMESALAATDMLKLAADSLRVERAYGLETMEAAQSKPSLLRRALDSGDESMALLFLTASIRPSGWWDQDRSAYSLGIQRSIDGVDLGRATLSPSAFPIHHLSDMGQVDDVPFVDELQLPISTTALASLQNMGTKAAKAETYRRLARLACRLEEFRIAQGHYPEKLEELPDLPAHLNQEVLSEEPLRYRRKGDGYLLYSVGWNQKDDGGVVAKDDKDGDWVWPSP